MFEKVKIWKMSGKVFLTLLSLAYLSIGIYSVLNVGLAGDETAHLGAAHSYVYGQGANVEHPTLLKNLNAGVLAVFFNDYQTENREQWSRGVDYQLNAKAGSSAVLQSSRLVYLFFNLGFIFCLWLFAWKYQFLKKDLAWILGILYIFSPSFSSQNFLLTFDVASGWTSLVVFLAMANLSKGFLKDSWKDFLGKTGWLAFSLFLALNVKFSNFIWIAILLGLTFLSGVFFMYKQNDKALLKLLSSFGIVSLCNLFGIWFLNLIAFRAEFNWSLREFWNPILLPFYFYLKGLVMTLGRSEHNQPNFIDDHFEVITYHQFIERVFWFKENPMLIILFFVAILAGIFWVIKNFNSKLLLKAVLSLTTGSEANFREKISAKKQQSLKLFLKENSSKLLIGILAVGFPFLYLISSWNSRLTIGYRHFYPVLIYIYALLGLFLSLNLKSKIGKYLVSGFLIFYIVFGVLAINQGISYTNIFWQKQKWKLTTDSTINWDQEQAATFRYLKQENLFKSSNEDLLTGKNWNTALAISGGPNTNIAMQELIGKGKKLKDFWSPFVDLREIKIENLKQQYLIVDSNIIQLLSDKQKENSIARSNLDYLQTRSAIFDRNQVIFIYKL